VVGPTLFNQGGKKLLDNNFMAKNIADFLGSPKKNLNFEPKEQRIGENVEKKFGEFRQTQSPP
jgi:hypothetical protein